LSLLRAKLILNLLSIVSGLGILVFAGLAYIAGPIDGEFFKGLELGLGLAFFFMIGGRIRLGTQEYWVMGALEALAAFFYLLADCTMALIFSKDAPSAMAWAFPGIQPIIIPLAAAQGTVIFFMLLDLALGLVSASVKKSSVSSDTDTAAD